MNIAQFFDYSVGKWFSQRTSYHLAQMDQWHQSDKTDLFVERLQTQDPAIASLCATLDLDPQQAIGGLQTNWSKTLIKSAGTTVLVAIADASNAPEGKLLASTNPPTPIPASPSPIVGRYLLNPDDSLTLITERGDWYNEERIWFAAPNLRLRTSLMRQTSTGFSASSFYSEIRLGTAPEAPQPLSATHAA